MPFFDSWCTFPALGSKVTRCLLCDRFGLFKFIRFLLLHALADNLRLKFLRLFFYESALHRWRHFMYNILVIVRCNHVVVKIDMLHLLPDSFSPLGFPLVALLTKLVPERNA